MALPARTLEYLLITLATTPAVVLRLIEGIPADAAGWDLRPDPERFSPREVVAHLADWERVFLLRFQVTVAEDEPPLPNFDEGRLAAEGAYGDTNPHEQAAHFLQRRTELVRYLRSLPEGVWDRVGVHPKIGRMTLAEQAVQVAGHDGYHMAQIVSLRP